MTTDQVSGLILTGGQGRRLQPSSGPSIEKGLLMLHGQPLVQRMQHYMQTDVAKVFISANQHLSDYSNYGQVIPDDPELGGFQGPLAGIASVLPYVTTPWLFVMPVDVFNPPADLLMRLMQQASVGTSPIYYARAARQHPLCMLMRTDLIQGLRAYLATGQRKVREWQQQQAAMSVSYPADQPYFLNINTPEDLQQVRQWNTQQVAISDS